MWFISSSSKSSLLNGMKILWDLSYGKWGPEVLKFCEIYFHFFSLELKCQLTRTWVRSFGVTCRSKIEKKILFWLVIQDDHHGGHLENLFFASSPEPKGQLTWNLVRIIKVTCRSEITKIVPIRNTRWLPQLPSWKSILNFSWTERPIDMKFNRKIVVDQK